MSIQGGDETQKTINLGGKLSFILSFLFPERLHCCYIYFHCSYLYNNYNYSLEPCALSFIISFWDLIEFPYFAETTQRGDRGGWKQAQRLRTGWRQGDFTDDSNVPSFGCMSKTYWKVFEGIISTKSLVGILLQHTQNKRLFTCM